MATSPSFNGSSEESVPMILYASRTWYKVIETKSTYLKIVKKLQRKILITMTRVYKKTTVELNIINPSMPKIYD